MQAHIVAGGLVLLAGWLSACSVERLALDSLGGVLESSRRALERENDLELAGEALPFSLKLIDGLLLEQPERRELLIAGASGYVAYARVYVSGPARRLSYEDIDAARGMRARARNLFLRGHEYALRALELDYPGIGAALQTDPGGAAARVGAHPERDVESMYWSAAALGLAVSASRNEPALLARLPEVQALLERALALDESWGDGALHEFALSLGDVADISGDALRAHYERAVALSEGRRAGVHVAYAEAYALPRQDRESFVALLDRALAIDLDAEPGERLANVVAQRRAEWLLSDLDRLFLE